MPDGRRATFYYEIKQQNPVTLRAAWVAETGVYDKLEMIGDNRILLDANSHDMLGFFHDYLKSGNPGTQYAYCPQIARLRKNATDDFLETI